MEEISLKAQELFSIGNFGVTNGLFLTLIVSLLLITFSLIFKSKIRLVPGKVQGVVEMGVEGLLGLMESTYSRCSLQRWGNVTYRTRIAGLSMAWVIAGGSAAEEHRILLTRSVSSQAGRSS